MKAICEGRKTRREVVDETVEQYRAVYVRTQARMEVLRTVSSNFLTQVSIRDEANFPQSFRKYMRGEANG